MSADRTVVPFSLKDADSLIERLLPVQRLSIEAQVERKSNAGQTLTGLGSYWKGRKPLILVRACVLGALLPATGDDAKDLEIFELLLAMDDEAFLHRVRSLSVEDVKQYGGELRERLLTEADTWQRLPRDEKRQLLGQVLGRMPYAQRLHRRSLRPEEMSPSGYERIWDRVNAHLGTSVRSHAELCEQLGIMRFGHRPLVADTFCGGGSIPFEAARLGCEALASDLNPIACMLTWGALHVVGGDETRRAAIARAQTKVADAVDAEVRRLDIEQDGSGARAKTYLYCLEVRCPETGWLVPLANSWLISENQATIARLVPDPEGRRFQIEIVSGVSEEEIGTARKGTVQSGSLVYTLDGIEHRTPIATIRGDRRVGKQTENDLRRWERQDFVPRLGDIFQERLYCIQWVRPKNDQRRREEIFFRGVTSADLTRERKIEELVRAELSDWQEQGWVPDMAIETGDKTWELIRTRGWTHWHHLFTPRHLLLLKLLRARIAEVADPEIAGALSIALANTLDKSSRLAHWNIGFPGRPGVAPSSDCVKNVFYNQALNTFFNYGTRSFATLRPVFEEGFTPAPVSHPGLVKTALASAAHFTADIYITDPPYADAVHYHEISEFFIAWLRKRPPAPFAGWVWDSRRTLAIQGSGEKFRQEMIAAYASMARDMPANGRQIVMFTHQDSSVWSDMAGIFWGAGLQVAAAWYIATETSSELRKGGYVQGTIILILRKRRGDERTYKDELGLELREKVKVQIAELVGLNESVERAGRREKVFEENDLQMAGYAAALEVLTAYTHIDSQDMTREALRPRTDGERSVVDDLIDFAVSVANEATRPDGIAEAVWERLAGSERFYLRMLEMEGRDLRKLDNYQNFAKAFKVKDFAALMASQRPGEARLRSSAEWKGTGFTGEFGTTLLRGVLYALHELLEDKDSDLVMRHLRDHLQDYLNRRQDIIAVARYLADRLALLRPDEASAARILGDLVQGEKLGR